MGIHKLFGEKNQWPVPLILMVIANKSRTTAFLCMDLTTFLFHPRLGIIERILFWNFLPEYLAIRTK